MKVALTLTDQDIDPEMPVKDARNFSRRKSARAVVIDDLGAVGLVYASKGMYYELPGGGLQIGETMEAGLRREVLEELGCDINILKSLGVVEEHRSFTEIKQTSYCYLVLLKGVRGTPTYSEDELRAGFEVRWVQNIDEALRLVEEGIDSISDYGLKFMRRRDLHVLRVAKQYVQ